MSGAIPHWWWGVAHGRHVFTPSIGAAVGDILCGVGDLQATDEFEDGQAVERPPATRDARPDLVEGEPRKSVHIVTITRGQE